MSVQPRRAPLGGQYRAGIPDQPVVEYRTNSRTDDWHPAPGMAPAEVAELNQIMGWAKYRIASAAETPGEGQ